MSYDLNLVKKYKEGSCILQESEFVDNEENLSFEIESSKQDGKVYSFSAFFKNDPEFRVSFQYYDDLEDEFHKSVYSTQINYFRPPLIYDKFFNILILSAKILGFDIVDRQLEDDACPPDDYKNSLLPSVMERLKTGYEYHKTSSVVNWKNNMTNKSRYFIQYMLISRDTSGKKNILVRKDETLYASSVEVGQTLKEVIKKEMGEIFGLGESEYKTVFIQDGDKAKDRYGSWLPRKNLFIEVGYFEPSAKNLSDWSWVEYDYPDIFVTTDEEYTRVWDEFAYDPLWSKNK